MVLRPVLLAAGRSYALKRLALALPQTRRLANRFVPGETLEECVAAAHRLVGNGLLVTIDLLGEDTTTQRRADQVTDGYVELLRRIAAEGLADRVEVSIKPSALGSRLSGGRETALDNARLICATARDAGTTVTVDMEDHTTTDDTLWLVRRLREEFPWVGAVIQAYLRRSVSDCDELAGDGSRVRLCKGAYAEPASVAYQHRSEVDASYLACAAVLLRGTGTPMLATHDPAMITGSVALAERISRGRDEYEIQMLYGIRPGEQQRLAAAGHRVRVYLPYGSDWYAYFMRRLAERPANLRFFLTALIAKDGREQPRSRRAGGRRKVS